MRTTSNFEVRRPDWAYPCNSNLSRPTRVWHIDCNDITCTQRISLYTVINLAVTVVIFEVTIYISNNEVLGDILVSLSLRLSIGPSKDCPLHNICFLLGGIFFIFVRYITRRIVVRCFSLLSRTRFLLNKIFFLFYTIPKWKISRQL